MKRIITAILLISVIVACGKKSADEKVKSMDIVLTPPPGDQMESKNADIAIDKSVGNGVDAVRYPTPVAKQDAEINNNVSVEKKLIKEGNISFETDNINATKKNITTLLNKVGGYIEQENESNDNYESRKEYKLTARIPANNFDQFLNGVTSNADKIDSKNISVRDVTANFIDITSRLANKKKLEERYLDLLKKSSKVSDLLEVEEKLNEIRSDIESTQTQLNYLNKDISYSTLNLTFYTKQAVKDNGLSFGYRIKSAFGDGWDTVGMIFFGIIGLWPYWLVLFILIFFARRWFKH